MTKEMMEIEYNRARNLSATEDLDKLIEARNIFENLDGYKNSNDLLNDVIIKINGLKGDLEEKKLDDYNRALLLMQEKKSAYRLDQAIKLFKELGDYKDSKELLEKCEDYRNKVILNDKKNLDRFKLLGYLFAGIGVVAVVFIILAMIWQSVNNG